MVFIGGEALGVRQRSCRLYRINKIGDHREGGGKHRTSGAECTTGGCQHNQALIYMNIRADIPRIEELAVKREKENLHFRSFLKGTNISGYRIDAAVHELYSRISKQIDCRECANC
jgi:hypothetical protein